MRIVENTTERLVLKGTPGSVHWMAYATLLGLTLMSISAWFAWVIVNQNGGYLPLIPISIGFLLGSGFCMIGLVSLVVGRMRLVLDRATCYGSYDVYSPVIDVGKSCSFRLEEIDSVTIEHHEEARPGNGHHGGFPAKVCRARMRLRKPRRAIVLDETENGQEQRVKTLAEAVARWLDRDVIQQS